jgi:hypothetical protein
VNLHHPPFPSYSEIAVADAVMHVRHAGRHLLEATFRLDEGDLHCEALDEIASDTSALFAVWAGRRVGEVCQPKVAAHVAESAREWRRTQGRAY